MDCSRFEELISPYMDGELATEEIIRLEKHFDKCSSCRKLLQDFQMIRQKTRKMEIPHPSIKIEKAIVGYGTRKNYFLRFIFSTSLFFGIGALLFQILSTPEVIVKENPKDYYIVKEEEAPYIETVYEKQGNYILTDYEGGSL